MRKLTVFVFSGLVGIGLLFGDLTMVYSQEEFTLEEVLVTAQKREENQQKVAIAMEVLSGDVLKELGKNDIDEILSNISSVLVQSQTDGLRVSIRGMSNDNNVFGNLQNSTPTVAVNTDGVPTNRNSSNANLYDIERVEVLFGPQSTMYASSTPGGIVNVITADPKTDRYEASGTLEYGSYELLHTEGALNAPISDKMALRAAFSTSVHDGYLSNGSNDEDAKSARLKVLFQPSDKFSILLSGELSDIGGQGHAQAKAFINQDDSTYPDGTPLTDPWTSASGSAGRGRDLTRKKVFGRMDWDLGYVGTLSIIPSYLRTTNHSEGTTSRGTTEYYNVDDGSGSEKNIEARMASSADFPFEWILGVNIYYSRDNQSSVSENQTDPTAVTNISDRWNEQDTKAAYGNIKYPITDRFRASAGARISQDDNTTYNHQIPGKGAEAETFEGSKMEYSKPNYKLGFEYDISDSSMLYGNWSSSYRMNGSGITPGGVQFPPEELTAYTLGAKNRFFGNKLQLNVSGYYYDYLNYFAVQGPVYVPQDTNGDGIWQPAVENIPYEVVLINVGDAKVYGFDLQTSTIITEKDRLDLSVSYIRKYFIDLIFDLPWQANEWFGIPDQDYANKQMPQAPNWNVSASYSHNFTLGNGGVLTVDIRSRYASKYLLNWQAKNLSLDIENIGTRQNPIYTGAYTATVTDTSDVRWQEPYHIEDISLVYLNPGGKWSLSFYVKNLTNYAVKRFLQRDSAFLGDPRTYGAVFSVRY